MTLTENTICPINDKEDACNFDREIYVTVVGNTIVLVPVSMKVILIPTKNPNKGKLHLFLSKT